MSLSHELVTSIRSFQELYAVEIPAGTELYRCQDPETDPEMTLPYRCKDTGKIGLYFSNNKWIPLGMILEYHKGLKLLKYKTKAPIKLFIGKYIFRYLEPNLFFESKEDMYNGKFRLNVNPKDSQYWNHIQSDAFPIHPIFDHNFWKTSQDTEIFLTGLNDIKLVEVSEVIYPDTALRYLKNHIRG